MYNVNTTKDHGALAVRVSLTTKDLGGTAHTCSGRHSQYSRELLAHAGSRSYIVRPA